MQSDKTMRSQTTPTDRIFSRLTFLVLLSFFVFLFIFFTFGDFEHVLCRVTDDAAYYFKIAENIAAGHGSTFDRINKTNGYQPLWLLLLIPFPLFLNTDPETLVRIYMVFELLLLLVAGFILYSLHSRFFRGRAGFISSILFIFLVYFQSAIGMESGALLLAIILLFYFCWRSKVFSSFSPGPAFFFGILLGLVMLARLDMLFLGMAVCGYCLLQIIRATDSIHDGIKRLSLIVSGSTVVVLPYLTYNALAFGAITPISAVLKSSFPYPSLNIQNVRMLGFFLLLFLPVAVFYLVWFVRSGGKTDKKNILYFRGGMAVLSATILIHFVHTMLFIDWAVYRWHFMPYALFGSLVFSEPLDHFFSKKRSWIFGPLLWVFVLVLFLSGTKRCLDRTFLASPEDSWHVRTYKAALWARNTTNPSDIFAMKDAGNFGYFSKRSVINLDGVVNSFDFQDVLDSGKLNDYFTRLNVRYIVQHAFTQPDTNIPWDLRGGGTEVSKGEYELISIRYRSQKYGTYSDNILLKRSSEVYKSSSSGGGDPNTLIIWEISRI